MKIVRLNYIGKKESLRVTMPGLKDEYTFNQENKMTAPVLYEDAAYLLKESPTMFRVVSQPFEVVGQSLHMAQDVADAPTVDDIPPVEKPMGEQKATSKKGKK